MTKRNKDNQPQPMPQADATVAPANVVELPNKPGKGSFLANLDKMLAKGGGDKAALLQETAAIFKEAHSLFEAGADEKEKAASKAGEAVIRLYQALTTKVVSMAEVSDLLGREFGFRKRKDTTTGKMVDGKTPDGEGKFIRDRLTRLVNAAEYATGGDGGNFFADIPAAEVATVLDRMDAGEIGPWTAYGELGELAKEYRPDRLPATFDSAKIAAIVDELLENVERSGRAFLADRDLAVAYLRLSRAIDKVDEAATAIAATETEPKGSDNA